MTNDLIDEESTADAIAALTEAIRKHGTIQSYHFRPESRCFMAGFRYTLGGICAAMCVLAASQAVAFLAGFVKGLIQ